jgi:transcription antitermination factor NusG
LRKSGQETCPSFNFIDAFRVTRKCDSEGEAVSSAVHNSNETSGNSLLVEPTSWYAIHTYPRHEKRVATELSHKAVETFLPLVSKMRQWSDRRKLVELPLFPCYTFVRIAPTSEARVRVLSTSGVIGLVGAAKEGSPIPDSQIEDVRTLLSSKIPSDPYPFLKVGQRVRICGGSLDGLEGILVRRNGSRRLVISIESIERSLSICIEGLDVEAI